ncbi:MAG: hypothetical protein J6W22_06585 [Fibrobacter sp.]|nr:hypothetical protein [Fibrobacter sp.]
MKVPKVSILLTFVFLIGCGDDKSSGGNPVVPDEPSSSIIAEPESSSSKEQSSSIKESSSSKAKSSSSKDNKLAKTSSSGKAKSSSSLARSSSSLKGSSSSDEVSSSSGEEKESSSSSVKASSSSSAKSSSSSKIVVESSSDVIVEESSSSVLSSSSMNSLYDAQNNTLTDLRDNQVYKTVTIGEQVWMAENLNYMPADTAGTIYSEATVCGGGELDAEIDSEKCNLFGRLYLKKVALYKITESNRQGICPDGWIIPNKSDFEKMVSFLGENSASKLKKDEEIWLHCDHSNYSGFSAVKAGSYSAKLKKYDSIESYIFYWENDTQHAYFFSLDG